ncbi:MAG: DUF1566 domain-containing protein [Nitrospinae bacterium]|nr:DUF1566 domain-containing protein [Nitrospinota bacterium]
MHGITKSALLFLFLALASGWALSWPAGVSAGSDTPKALSEDKRFVDNGDQTVTDTQTGLMWAKQDAYQRKKHWLNWSEAHAFIDQLNAEEFAGYRDWQLPTKRQLITLYEPGKLNGSQLGHEMNSHLDPLFAKDGAGALWAMEDNGHYNAFGVVFNTGTEFSAPKDSRSRKSVRAVRLAHP